MDSIMWMKDDQVQLSNGTIIHYIEHFIESKGYQENEKNNQMAQTTLLLLHGSFQTCHTWDDFLEQCVSQFINPSINTQLRIIAIDLRGHGDSSHRERYVLDEFAKDVSLFIEQMQLNNVVLVGMSLGGLVAIHTLFNMYNSNNEAVDRLNAKCVIVDITPNELYQGATQIRKSVTETLPEKSFEEWVQWAHSFNPLRPIDNLRKRLSYSLKRIGDSDLYTWKYDQKFALTSSEEDANVMWHHLQLLTEKSKVQFLLVIGGKSQVTTQQGQERFIQITGGQKIVIEDAGHSVQGDKPEEFTRHVLQFLLH